MSRRLNDDDLDLWKKVTRTTQALHRDKRENFADLLKKEAAETRSKSPKKSFHVEQKPPAKGVLPQVMPPSKPPINMDKKAFTRLKRGKLKPESTLDLHGMTVARAHDATLGFVMRAQSRGLRLILIITGKGKRGMDYGVMPEQQGILRRQLPHWLSLPPLNQMILQVTEAHGKHGGGGAFYVYLKRNR